MAGKTADVLYLSTESPVTQIAALENATYAPDLASPTGGQRRPLAVRARGDHPGRERSARSR